MDNRSSRSSKLHSSRSGDEQKDKRTLRLDKRRFLRGVYQNPWDLYFVAFVHMCHFGTVLYTPACIIRYGLGFIVLYSIFMAALAFPLFVIDMLIGKYSGQSPLSCFKNIAPICQGIAVSMALVAGLHLICNGIVAGIATFYLVATLENRMPWLECDFKNAQHFENSTCHHSNASYYYYFSAIFGQNPDLEPNQPLGNVMPEMIFGMLVVWGFSALFLCYGVNVMTRLSKIGGVLVILILVALFFASFGIVQDYSIYRIFAVDGMDPDIISMESLMNAASCASFTVCNGFGTFVTLSSYKTSDKRTLLMGLGAVVTATITSLILALVFACGLSSVSPDFIPEKERVIQGEYLAFAVMPMLKRQWYLGPFYAAISACGFLSHLTAFQTFVSSATDLRPQWRSYREWIVSGLAVSGFLLSLPLTVAGSRPIMDALIDSMRHRILPLFHVFEFLLIVLILGTNTLFKNASEIGIELNLTVQTCLKLAWNPVGPSCTIGLFALGCLTYRQVLEKYISAFVLAIVVFGPAIVWGIVVVKRLNIVESMKSTLEWIPATTQLSYTGNKIEVRLREPPKLKPFNFDRDYRPKCHQIDDDV